MADIFQGRNLKILIIIAFSVVGLSVFLIEWFDENEINPRIWKNWSCEEMRNFALSSEDEKLTDFQRARFHENLSLCMR